MAANNSSGTLPAPLSPDAIRSEIIRQFGYVQDYLRMALFEYPLWEYHEFQPDPYQRISEIERQMCEAREKLFVAVGSRVKSFELFDVCHRFLKERLQWTETLQKESSIIEDGHWEHFERERAIATTKMLRGYWNTRDLQDCIDEIRGIDQVHLVATDRSQPLPLDADWASSAPEQKFETQSILRRSHVLGLCSYEDVSGVLVLEREIHGQLKRVTFAGRVQRPIIERILRAGEKGCRDEVWRNGLPGDNPSQNNVVYNINQKLDVVGAFLESDRNFLKLKLK